MLKKCKTCPKEQPEELFKANRNQCYDCINYIRRRRNKMKMDEERKAIKGKSGSTYYLEHREDRLKRAKENYYANFANSLVRSLKQRAKTMDVPFDLDIDFVKELYSKQSGKCLLTGIAFILDKSDTSRRPFAPSIDRINSKLGYTKNNVRLVCTIVNLALNEFGDSSFDKMCRAYVENTVCSF